MTNLLNIQLTATDLRLAHATPKTAQTVKIRHFWAFATWKKRASI